MPADTGNSDAEYHEHKKKMRHEKIAKLLVQQHAHTRTKNVFASNKVPKNWSEKELLSTEKRVRRRDSIHHIVTEKLEEEGPLDEVDPVDVKKKKEGTLGRAMATVFEHIFVSPETFNDGTSLSTDFYKRKTFLTTIKTTQESVQRREVPVATYVRNSTPLTRSYPRLGNTIKPEEILASYSRKSNIVQIAENFTETTAKGKKRRNRILRRRHRVDKHLEAALKNIEFETFSLSNAEKAIAFPKDFARPFIGNSSIGLPPVGTVRRRKKKKKRKDTRVDLNAEYKLKHSTSQKTLRSLQRELLTKLEIEKQQEKEEAAKEKKHHHHHHHHHKQTLGKVDEDEPIGTL